MVNVVIEPLHLKKSRVEITEYHGEGHPDALCSVLCQKASNSLANYYLKHFNKILDFSIDKTIIVPGTSTSKFNGGSVNNIPKIIVTGRATGKINNCHIPVKKLIRKTVETHMTRFPFLQDFDLEIHMNESPKQLKESIHKPFKIANDTAFVSAHFPPSRIEATVTKVGEYLNSNSFRNKNPYIGKDVKIVGIRENNKTTISLSIAFIDHFISDMREYKKLKEQLSKNLSKQFQCNVIINNLDSYKKEDSVFLTVSGLGLENGANGCSLSHSGKNINHPERVYKALSQKIAEKVSKELNGITKVQIMNHVGNPLEEPEVTHIQFSGNMDLNKIKKIVDNSFMNLDQLQNKIIKE